MIIMIMIGSTDSSVFWEKGEFGRVGLVFGECDQKCSLFSITGQISQTSCSLYKGHRRNTTAMDRIRGSRS